MMRLRVVCGLGVTMASFSPTMRLSSVDLPTLGRPRIATVPATGCERSIFGVADAIGGASISAQVSCYPGHAVSASDRRHCVSPPRRQWRRRRGARDADARARRRHRPPRRRRRSSRTCALKIAALRRGQPELREVSGRRPPARRAAHSHPGHPGRGGLDRRRRRRETASVALVGDDRPARRRRETGVGGRGDGRAHARVPDGRPASPAATACRRGCSRAPTTSTAAGFARCMSPLPEPGARSWSRAGAIRRCRPGKPLGGFHLIAASSTRAAGGRRARAGGARRAGRRRRRHRLGRGAGRRRTRRVPDRALERRRLRHPRPAHVPGRRLEPGGVPRRKNRVRRFQLAFGPAREQRFDVEIPEDPAADAARLEGRRTGWRCRSRCASSCVTVIVTEVTPGQRRGAAEELRRPRPSATWRCSPSWTARRGPSGWSRTWRARRTAPRGCRWSIGLGGAGGAAGGAGGAGRRRAAGASA